MKIIKYVLSFLIIGSSFLIAQNRVITTGAPFLRITPDARSGGMADVGVATSPDNFSQYWNPAKNVFNENDMGIGVSYTPYLNNLTNDIFLLNGSFFTHLGEENNSALGLSLYYFNMGEIQLNKIVGGQISSLGRAKPNELSLDVSYGLKLSENYSMAVAARYIRSDLFNGFNDTNSSNSKAANTFAVDVSGFYMSDKFDSFSETEGRVRAGFNVSNIGPKLNYSNSDLNKANLPTNFRLGAGYDFLIGEDHTIGFTTEVNKLLVPTPREDLSRRDDVSVLNALFSSWGDAPGGFSEELKEFTTGFGLEYNYINSFFFRTGYYNESKLKGDRRFLSLGLGIKYQTFGIDFAYLIPTSQVNSALENTLRFSLTWNFLPAE